MGSGGAVRIVANSIENLGVIEAKGGDASGLDPRENGSRYLRDAGGAGGGGRVALLADGVITRGMINLNGGQGNADGAVGYPALLCRTQVFNACSCFIPDFWNLDFGYWRFLVSFIWLTG